MSNQSALDTLIYFLFPTWRLNTTPWKDLWIEEERRRVISVTRWAMAVMFSAMVLHYFFVDTPMGLTADRSWFYYRFGIAALSAFFFALTYFGGKSASSAKAGYWIVSIVASWAQAHSMTWYHGVSPFWAFIIASACAVFYRGETISNLFLFAICVGAQWPSFLATNQDMNVMVGSQIVAFSLVILALRARTEAVVNFINIHRQIQTERILSDLQKEMADQIRAFLPDKINRDLKKHLRNGFSVTQAIAEVLRPKTQQVACMFSDIRGYTHASKNLDYIEQSALPNIKAATSVVEQHDGVPRLIGDLVFAYFENDSSDSYLLNSFAAASEILKDNFIQNSSAAAEGKITRYIILDCGMVVCGNLGGANSSREITALGKPVNRCSRIDQLTKDVRLRSLFGDEAIVLSETFVEALEEIGFAGNFEKVSLSELGLVLRDFEDEKVLYYTREIQALRPLNNESTEAA